MTYTVDRRDGEFYVDFYEDGELVDDAGPFDDREDAVEAAERAVKWAA